ncbi:tetratricopeptide repeat protein [Helicobacter cappadocius]|uniref:Flagellar protein n=1 Tax=Helicobacter cappadocius TaxID=3063998 RepID=A0AA90PU53_9HELI|nr:MULTISPECIES: tetratricopeptide repeat protein [unclassified Helicobacter]MDO7253718.1 flagellar protein [Helicobacter sp. faydin-H75]MDP2539594.1 flagellar protein [Helicobacter sp. faydin-H76]
MHPFKIFLLIATISNSLFSFEIVINYGKQNSENFAVLNIKNDKPFPCIQKSEHNGEKTLIECTIDAIPKEGFTPTKTIFFDFYYQMIDGKFHLFIEPKKKAYLFSIPEKLKENTLIFREKPSSSKAWQIVGYEKKIPFLSGEIPNGLNFPILIEDAQTPYIAELDIDDKPLKYMQGPDFEAYLNAKSLIKNKDYYKALTVISNTLKKYPDTIFKKDLYLYQIVALSEMDGKQQETIIENSLNWIRQYSSDSEIPQVLYILAKAYDEIRYHSEAKHYYNRIIEEYPKNRYAPLSKMRLALDAINDGNIGLANIYFQQAYTQAKDMQSASAIALNWAKFEVEKNNLPNAIELVNKILDVYPQFFDNNTKKSYEIVKYFEKNKMYKISAKIAQYIVNTTTDNSTAEDISYDLGMIYEKAGDFDNAHQANLAYLKKYPSTQRSKAVKRRDDDILFDISGNNEEKLKRYEYIIQKYPNTEQSKKATELKAKLFLDEKQYSKVIQMRSEIGEKSPILNEAINSLIKESLSENNCKNANIFLLQTSNYSLNDEEKLKAFDCLYKASLNENASIISSGEIKNSKNLNQKLQWLYRDAKNFYKLGDYKSSILSARDALSIAQSTKETQFYDIAFVLFSDLANIKSKDEAMKVYADLDKWFKDDKRMIKVYAKLLQWAIQDKNDTTVEIYAKNLISLQNKYKIDEYTPWAEFELINSLVQTKKFSEAITQSNTLLTKNLSNEQKQKALYTKGSIENLQKLPQEAKNSFEKCILIKDESAWKKLCSQGLELLKEK